MRIDDVCFKGWAKLACADIPMNDVIMGERTVPLAPIECALPGHIIIESSLAGVKGYTPGAAQDFQCQA